MNEDLGMIGRGRYLKNKSHFEHILVEASLQQMKFTYIKLFSCKNFKENFGIYVHGALHALG
jgi:hypothetical protein